MILRRFEYASTERFREIRIDGSLVTIIVGKIGAAGVGQPTRYPSEAEARAFFEERVAGYLANGAVELAADVADAQRAANPPKLFKEITAEESAQQDREREAREKKRAEDAANAPRIEAERKAAAEAKKAASAAKIAAMEAAAAEREKVRAERERRLAGLTEWPAPPVWLERVRDGERWGVAVFEGALYETRPGGKAIDRREPTPPETAEAARDRLVEKRRVDGYIPWVDPASVDAPRVVPAEPAPAALDASAAWRRIRKAWVELSMSAQVGPTRTWRRSFRPGGREDDHVVALDRFERDECPAALDAKDEALAMVMIEYLSFAESGHRDAIPANFVDFWVASRGVLFAFEVLDKLEPLGVFVDHERRMHPATGVHQTPWDLRFRGWRRLRDHLEEALRKGEDAAYAGVRTLARARFTNRAPQMKVGYVIALRRELGVVARVAQLLLEFPVFPNYGLALLPSVFDGVLGRALVERSSAVELDGVGDDVDDFVDVAGERALDALALMVERARAERDASSSDRIRWATLCKRLHAAIGRVLSPRAVPLLASGFDDPEQFGGLVTNALHQPDLWIDKVAAAAASGGVRGTMAAAVLGWMRRRAPDVRASAPGVGAKRALRLASARAGKGREVAPADAVAIPEVLRDPPWRRPRAVARPVIRLEPRDVEPTMRWSAVGVDPRRGAAGRAAWLRPEAITEERRRGRAQIEIDRDVEATFDAARDGLVKFGALDPDFLVDASPSIALAAWAEVPFRTWQDDVPALRAFVAAHELAALAPMFGIAEQRTDIVLPLFMPFDAPALAPICARVLGTPGEGELAAAWLVAHPEAAARGLLPAVVGPPSDRRDQAERALHLVARRGGRDAILRTARERSDEVAAVVVEVCDVDPATRPPDEGARAPMGWDARALPAPRLRGTSCALGADAMDALGELLGSFAIDGDHPWIEAIRAAFEPEDLADLGRELAIRWVASGARTSAGTLRASEWFADDDGVRLVADLARSADDATDFGRSSIFMVSLERIASGSAGPVRARTAIAELTLLERRARTSQVRIYAKCALERVAAKSGVDVATLCDRAVPDFGLDDAGTLVLDMGSRAFRVGFDEHLEPFVRSAAGERLGRLPDAIDEDDPEKAADALDLWRRLKRDVESTAVVAFARLEEAMSTRRALSLVDFDAHLAGHRLLRHVARRLLFRCAGLTFRVAEDGSFADVDDGAATLPEGAEIRIVHPVELAGADLSRWTQIFTDYEIVQPFAQLRRALYRHEGDAAALEIGGFGPGPISNERQQALFRDGWLMVGGTTLRKRLAHAPYDVAFDLTGAPLYSAVPGTRSVGAVKFISRDAIDWQRVPIRDVHPVDVSEGVLLARWLTEPA